MKVTVFRPDCDEVEYFGKHGLDDVVASTIERYPDLFRDQAWIISYVVSRNGASLRDIVGFKVYDLGEGNYLAGIEPKKLGDAIVPSIVGLSGLMFIDGSMREFEHDEAEEDEVISYIRASLEKLYGHLGIEHPRFFFNFHDAVFQGTVLPYLNKNGFQIREEVLPCKEH